MDPKLNEQLQQLLSSLLQNAQDAASWAKGQVPILIQEKIALSRVEESIYMLISFLLVALAIVLIRKLWAWSAKECKRNAYEADSYVLGALVGTAVIFLIGIIAPLVLNLHGFLSVWIAPRLYIIEWLMSLKK